ncbi:FAD/FMN-containing dehydrogenases [hydrothermal vent metagenome]|uniref:FAD/FMN-containing dehydrogenases n=1 Tax=hydrothermal vent metagenome TaxID=652676 RepID=A0A3B0YLD1_9ZZZZ
MNSDKQDKNPRIREIPYNYTSYSDREIVIRYMGEEMWLLIEKLRGSRRTGHSARMLFEVLGDMWVVNRNPFIQDDLLDSPKRLKALVAALNHRLHQIENRAEANLLALQLVENARIAVKKFKDWFPAQRKIRKKILKSLSQVTKKHNIDFSGIARVSHVTDASDWRVEYPCVVVHPDNENEIPGLVSACIELGLSIIGRGGGTGYTGAAVPLIEETAVINLEKLLEVDRVQLKTLPGTELKTPVIKVGAGAITKSVAEMAVACGYVFAVDPTSQDSSTIGGNIAMNAGGKKAVLWGTTIDNLSSWKMVTAEGCWINVERLDHNLGKIHLQETVRFRVRSFNAEGKSVDSKLYPREKIISLPGRELRKHGLGKDVTNKFLGGIPGIQKEGCDGIITSAEFILHQFPAHTYTVCLEFFGSDLRKAIPAIVETKDYLDQHKEVILSGLEHLDERYVKAIGYSSKSARGQSPKMVLLIDISSESEHQLNEVIEKVLSMSRQRGGEGFVASSPEARKQFWADRSRTAAIAAHTNAFKINEDVVIPLEKLADYSEGIERINIEQSIKNKLSIIESVQTFFENDIELWMRQENFDASPEFKRIFDTKIIAGLAICAKIKSRWKSILHNMDLALTELPAELEDYVKSINIANDNTNEASESLEGESDNKLIDLLLARVLDISFRESIEKPLKDIFNGQGFALLHQKLDSLHADIRTNRLFVATHMHAGDGNVHTNIPVNSHNYAMMREAEHIVDHVMALAVSLNGVISGEHGIGITKLQYLPKETIDEFLEFKQKVDPQNVFNRHKLSHQGGLERAYTPSLQLLQQEALILEASELNELNNATRHCLRCGKCKPVCNTHIPQANLSYSPRNKILATGLIIEAFIYEEQTRRGISLKHFEAMNDIADHCTVCHKCLAPCPVDIDFGDVTVKMRNILRQYGHKKYNPGTWLSLKFLNMMNPRGIKIMRLLMISIGYRMQRLAYRVFKPFQKPIQHQPKPTPGKPTLTTQIVQFMAKPLPAAMPRKAMRTLLAIEDTSQVPIISDPQKITDNSDAVFYFPGCGSERLFSQVGMATLTMLAYTGARTVLPPAYLCCGYPQTANGDEKKGESISTENRVLFHRIANTLNYLDIKTVVVSCGTCMDQLLKYQFDKIFPGCRLLDIHEYLLEKKVTLESGHGRKYIYHDPCHSPMKTYEPLKVAQTLMAAEVVETDRCCGEAGTFGISRPDIAAQIRFRKQQSLEECQQQLLAPDFEDSSIDVSDTKSNGISQQVTDTHKVQEVKILTACPSCQQGLSGYQPSTNLETDYIVVELAKHLLGDQWEKDFMVMARTKGIEKVLL